MSKLIKWLGLGILLLSLNSCTKNYSVVFMYNAALVPNGIYVIVNQTKSTYSIIDYKDAVEYNSRAGFFPISLQIITIDKTAIKVIESKTQIALNLEWF